MFLLSTHLSYFIKSDSVRCNLNLLFSLKRVFKIGVMTLQQDKTNDSFLVFFTRFPVKGVIPRCSEALTKKSFSNYPY